MGLFETAAKNSGFFLLGSVFERLLRLLAILVVARQLGETEFGKYSFLFAFLTFFIITCRFGMDEILTREVSRDKKEAARYLGKALVLRIFLGVISMFFAAVFIHFFGKPEEMVSLVYVGSVVVLLTSLQAFYNVVYMAFLEARFMTLSRLVGSFSFLLFCLFLAARGADLFLFVVANVVSLFLSVVCGWFFSRRFVSISPAVDWEYWKHLLGLSAPLALAGVLSVVYYKIDTVMLSFFRPDAEVGFYSAAFRLIESLAIIPTAVIASAFPILSEAFSKASKRLESGFMFAFRYLVLLALPMAFGTAVLADRIMELFYGASYVPGGSALLFLIWAEAFAFVNMLFLAMLNSSDNQNKSAFVMFAQAVFNVCFNLVFIPEFGFLGAAITTVFTGLLGFGLGYLMVYRGFGFSPGGFLPRPFLAAALMGALAFVLRGFSLFFVIPVCAFFYCALVVVLKAVPERTWVVVRKALKKVGFS